MNTLQKEINEFTREYYMKNGKPGKIANEFINNCYKAFLDKYELIDLYTAISTKLKSYVNKYQCVDNADERFKLVDKRENDKFEFTASFSSFYDELVDIKWNELKVREQEDIQNLISLTEVNNKIDSPIDNVRIGIYINTDESAPYGYIRVNYANNKDIVIISLKKSLLTNRYWHACIEHRRLEIEYNHNSEEISETNSS